MKRINALLVDIKRNGNEGITPTGTPLLDIVVARVGRSSPAENRPPQRIGMSEPDSPRLQA